MIIVGVILLLLAYFIGPIIPLPYPIWELVHAGGVILLIIGVILLILSFLGFAPGPGFGPARNGRKFYY